MFRNRLSAGTSNFGENNWSRRSVVGTSACPERTIVAGMSDAPFWSDERERLTPLEMKYWESAAVVSAAEQAYAAVVSAAEQAYAAVVSAAEQAYAAVVSAAEQA